MTDPWKKPPRPPALREDTPVTAKVEQPHHSPSKRERKRAAKEQRKREEREAQEMAEAIRRAREERERAERKPAPSRAERKAARKARAERDRPPRKARRERERDRDRRRGGERRRDPEPVPAPRPRAQDAPESQDAPRRSRKERLARRRRRRVVAQYTLAALLAGAVVTGAIVTREPGAPDPGRRQDDDDRGSAVAVAPQPLEEIERTTLLLFGARENAGPAEGALWMTLMSYDPDRDQAAVVYVPAHAAVEVPGRGLQGVGQSYASGGIPLLLISAENLLGIPIDHYLELSDSDMRVLLNQIGDLAVDVPSDLRVPAGNDQARVLLSGGSQTLQPKEVVQMLYLRGIGGDDVDLGSRHLAFWDAFLEAFADPSEAGEAVLAVEDALSETDTPSDDLAAFFSTLAALDSPDVTITTLPVTPVSAGDSELYAVDDDELRAFMASTVGISTPAGEEIRVQVLNGNGVPGIGQEVASELVGKGFRVILSGNARRLNYKRTLIITYDDSPEGHELALRAKRLLGVGEVQVSAQRQGIVDLTIVVGKDYVRAQ